MSRGWTVVLLAGAATVLIKAAGSLVLGARAGSPRMRPALVRLAPATFGALIALEAFADGRTLAVGPRAAALALGVVGAWRRWPPLLVLAAAALAVAALRRILP